MQTYKVVYAVQLTNIHVHVHVQIMNFSLTKQSLQTKIRLIRRTPSHYCHH